jgi:hypothetical protein
MAHQHSRATLTLCELPGELRLDGGVQLSQPGHLHLPKVGDVDGAAAGLLQRVGQLGGRLLVIIGVSDLRNIPKAASLNKFYDKASTAGTSSPCKPCARSKGCDACQDLINPKCGFQVICTDMQP